MSSAASSSSGRAEQPATVSSSSSSAEKPATPSHWKIVSIRDVQRWLAEEPIASCSSADAQRIREAVAVLSQTKPRQEDVEPLQSKWHGAQRQNRKRRPLQDVIEEFRTKVIEAAQTLQRQLPGTAEQPAVAGSSTTSANGLGFLSFFCATCHLLCRGRTSSCLGFGDDSTATGSLMRCISALLQLAMGSSARQR